MKITAKKYFAFVFFLAIASFIGYRKYYLTNAEDIKIEKNQEDILKTRDIEDYVKRKKSNKENIERPENENITFEYEQVEEINSFHILKHSGKKNKLLIGKLIVPSLNMNLSIGIGVSERNMSQGVGTMRADQVMGEGNYPVIGHNMNRRGVLLSDLNKMEIGNQIILEDKNYYYYYKATEKKIVNKSEGQIINNRKDIKEITIITCSPDGNRRTNNRIYVKGVFMDKVVK